MSPKCLTRKATLQLKLTPWNRIGLATSPIETARPEENQRLETRHVGASKRAFRARLPPIFTLCSFKIDVFRRVFLWTPQFATWKSMFRARLLSIWKLERIFWKRRKSIAPATQSDFWHVMKHAGTSPSAMPATRHEATRHLKPPKETPFAKLAIGTAIRPSRGRLRTAANGRNCKRNVERTDPQPPDP